MIAQQKVASAPNPEAIKVKTLPQLSPKVSLYNPKTPNPTDYLFQDSPLPQNNVLKGLVSEMKPSITVYAPFYKDHFGYSQSKDNLVLKAWWNNKSPKFAPATRDTPISNFADDVDDLIGLGNEINAALAGDWATIVLVLVIAATNPEIMGAVTILQTLGVLSGVNLMFVVKTAYSYISKVNDTKKQFNSI
ncbi:uncharacterized protein LLCC_2751 (plasmid) [Lactococcus cremoris]|nr:uncharacterized protein LLCC_2751 [Lactococcus cremoris]